MTLAPITDTAALVATREAWHTLAEHVLAAARYRVTTRIGLIATPGGFGTPPFGDDESVRVDGATLVVVRGGETTTTPITTVRAAAEAVGIVAGAPSEVYTPATPLEPDAPLLVDPTAAAILAAWFALATELLDGVCAGAGPGDDASAVQLWPEHFDLGIEIGDPAQHARATFGASPGDGAHPLPYLYVTRWPDVPDEPFWDDATFPGASLGYAALAEAPDATDAGRAFFARARAVLTRRAGA